MRVGLRALLVVLLFGSGLAAAADFTVVPVKDAPIEVVSASAIADLLYVTVRNPSSARVNRPLIHGRVFGDAESKSSSKAGASADEPTGAKGGFAFAGPSVEAHAEAVFRYQLRNVDAGDRVLLFPVRAEVEGADGATQWVLDLSKTQDLRPGVDTVLDGTAVGRAPRPGPEPKDLCECCESCADLAYNACGARRNGLGFCGSAPCLVSFNCQCSGCDCRFSCDPFAGCAECCKPGC